MSSTHSLLIFFSSFLETVCHSLAHGLRIVICRPQPPKCWDYGCEPSHLAWCGISLRLNPTDKRSCQLEMIWVSLQRHNIWAVWIPVLVSTSLACTTHSSSSCPEPKTKPKTCSRPQRCLALIDPWELSPDRKPIAATVWLSAWRMPSLSRWL